VAKSNPFTAITHGHSLAEAIVDAIREPLLVLDPGLRVITASRSFYRTFAVKPRKTEGRLLFELGDGQWNIPALRTLLEDIIRKRRTWRLSVSEWIRRPGRERRDAIYRSWYEHRRGAGASTQRYGPES